MTDPFHPLSVRDIPLLTSYFSRQDTRLCNASAGAAVLWQPYFQDASLELDGTLLLRVTDNGVGYTTKPQPTSHRDTGTGLRLLQTTLEMLNQRNTAPASCSLQTLPPPQHGTCITLRLPESYKFPPTHELVST